MLTRRKLLLALSLIIYLGALSTALGYAWYVRSTGYRKGLEAEVSAFLGMPTSIDAVTPRGMNTRRFSGVDVYLPGGRAHVFHCAEAVWRGNAAPGAGAQGGNALSLADGWFLVGSAEFREEDYVSLIRGGLGGDFEELELKRVELAGMRIQWSAPAFALEVDGAAGVVALDGDGFGRARLTAQRLNGCAVPEPIRIAALFTPGASLRVHSVELALPAIALPALKLDALLGGPVTQGDFTGTLAYEETEQVARMTVAGRVRGAVLEELTRKLAVRLQGTVDVDIERATFVAEELTELIFRGALKRVRLGSLAAYFDEPALDAMIDLDVSAAHLTGDRIRRLVATGDASGLSMEVLSRLLLGGRVTGTLRVTIEELSIVEDDVARAVIRLDVAPPVKEPGTIDRALIVDVAERLLDLDLRSAAQWLPEEVEYARLGARLIVEKGVLRVGGTHGLGGKTLLTVRVWNQEIGVVRAPQRAWPVPNLTIEWARGTVPERTWRELLDILPPREAPRDDRDGF